MSWAHGEWARIHPFANGNGRIARLWANWIAMRYGVPPFVRLRPRPEGTSYADAAAASMRGNFEAVVPVFRDMLEEFLHRLDPKYLTFQGNPGKHPQLLRLWRRPATLDERLPLASVQPYR
jgi:hypothetical protein